MAELDWTTIENGSDKFPKLFDFYMVGQARVDALATIALDPRCKERKVLLENALDEMVRVYCAYRMSAEGKGFGLSKSAGHAKMRESGLAACAMLIEREIGPVDVIWKLSRPGAMDWLPHRPKIVPWTILCSVKIIDCCPPKSHIASTGKKTKKTHVTHSFSAPLDKASKDLRSVLNAKFGKERIDAITLDDGDLFIKVEARAKELKGNPRLFLPSGYKDIINWYMKEHCQ